MLWGSRLSSRTALARLRLLPPESTARPGCPLSPPPSCLRRRSWKPLSPPDTSTRSSRIVSVLAFASPCVLSPRFVRSRSSREASPSHGRRRRLGVPWSSRLPSVPTFPPSPPSRPSLPPVRPRRPPSCDSRWSLSLVGLLLLLLRSWPCLQGFRALLWLRPCWPPSAEVWLESRSRPASLPDVDGSSWALLGWRSMDPRTDPEPCAERSLERCIKWSAERSGSAGRRSRPSATEI